MLQLQISGKPVALMNQPAFLVPQGLGGCSKVDIPGTWYKSVNIWQVQLSGESVALLHQPAFLVQKGRRGYSKVDILGLWYKIVNFGVVTDPFSRGWCRRMSL